MAEGVVFDMDGVLVDSAAAHQKSWQALATRYGREIPAGLFQQTFGQTSRDIIRRIWGEQTPESQILQLDHEKEAQYRELIAERVPLMPGCRMTLERLRNAGVLLAVATSGPPENMELVLSDGLIASYFTATVHGYEIARGKPAPDGFLLAAERLELPLGSCVVVEDAPVGIEAGLAAGMVCVGLVGTHPAETLLKAGAMRAVARLEEITPAFIGALVRGGPR